MANKMDGSGLLTFALSVVVIFIVYKMMNPSSEGYGGGAPFERDMKKSTYGCQSCMMK